MQKNVDKKITVAGFTGILDCKVCLLAQTCKTSAYVCTLVDFMPASNCKLNKNEKKSQIKFGLFKY